MSRTGPILKLAAIAGLALLAAACPGEPKTVLATLYFNSAADSVDEENTTVQLPLILRLLGFGGGANTIPFSIEVYDTGQGTAVPGSDYAAFSPTIITWQEGTLPDPTLGVNFDLFVNVQILLSP